MRINERDVAIITYIDRNNEENLERDFLYSLFKVAKFSGQVVVLDYGLSDDVKKRITRDYPIKLVGCKIQTDIFIDRYKDIVLAINDLQENISFVITMDSGDIWFQGSLQLFYNCNEGEIRTVQEMRIWDKDEWALKCLQNLSDYDRKWVLKTLSGTKVRNSGVIAGEKIDILNLVESVYKDVLICGYSFFGIDQIFVNYEIAKLNQEKRGSLNELLNYVLVSNVENFEIKKEKVYRRDGEKVIVVHNAGGNWRILNRPFVNRWSNSEQYAIENVRKISQTKEVKQGNILCKKNEIGNG